MGLAQVAPERPSLTQLLSPLFRQPESSAPLPEQKLLKAAKDGAYLGGADNLTEAYEAAIYRR